MRGTLVGMCVCVCVCVCVCAHVCVMQGVQESVCTKQLNSWSSL